MLLNKPQGITSFQALKTIKNRLECQKVGHTGTLDKFATGLLLILTCRLTKLSQIFMDMDKSYRATITFGKETDTLDPEGRVIARKNVPAFQHIKEAIESLTGDIEQQPPDYSAIHIEGKRAYQISKAGKKPHLKPRRVRINKIEVMDYNPPHLEVIVDCSKGTYIRSLARDIGYGANSCAYVTRLERTRVGEFLLEKAVSIEDFNPYRDLIEPQNFTNKIPNVMTVTLKDSMLFRLSNGCPLMDDYFLKTPSKDGTYAVFDRSLNLLAVSLRRNGRYQYRAVLSGRNQWKS